MTGLNPSQTAAVEHDRGPLLVLAGAGSGKTRVITHRIARLVARGVAPQSILAVSFTNKAANEMAERMVPLVGAETAGALWLSTFHSFGVRFLTEEKEALGYGEKFVVFDQGDSLGVVREVMHGQRRGSGLRKLDPAAVHARISLWKNQFVEPSEVVETDVEYDAAAREVYPRYQAALRSMCSVDFDDLVALPAKLLSADEPLRMKWRARLRYLLIDEYQDTNHCQVELLRQLVGEERNICVVGDDDQAIYGWRGADVRNILDFAAQFPGTTVVKLEENYRSRAPILAVANSAIARSTVARHAKVLQAVRGPGDAVRMVVAEGPAEEAKYVAREMGALREAHRRWADMAVLYRGNLQARLIEEELRAAGIPYRLFGGTQFFDRKEVKDAAAYLRVVVNPKDEISLRRILNYPPRGIGDTTVERIQRAARSLKRPFAEVARNLDRLDDVPEAARRGAAALFAALDAARERFRTDGGGLAPSARRLLDQVGLCAALADVADGAASGARRIDNVSSLLGAIERFEKAPPSSLGGERPSLGAFLARITLQTNDADEEEDPGNVVTLSTLHAAKGLEFAIVFLIGCVEGQLPHARTIDAKVTDAAPTDVEEERRLFYVGVTRARDRLYVCRPRGKTMRGKATPLTPSRFLDGLPEEHLEHIEDRATAALGAEEIAARTRAFLASLGRG
jgi:DNA helicase-2/ATP-dependent DNA helicase PcrA